MPVPIFLAPDVERALVDRIAADPRFVIDSNLAAAVVLVTRTTTDVTRALLASAPRLRAIGQATSGIDNIDAAAASERGIEILNLPGINANAVAELVIGQIITLTRTVPAYDRAMRNGVWNRADCATRYELRHHTLGILGYGNVGSRLAALAAVFGIQPIAFDPYVETVAPAVRARSLAELLAAADIISLHVPLTEETRRMIGPAEIAAMRPAAILVNAARGEILDCDAALEALLAGHLAGLAMDVFDPEPPSRAWPDHPQLILTPHIAGCTHEAKAAGAERLHVRLAAWAESHGADSTSLY